MTYSFLTETGQIDRAKVRAAVRAKVAEKIPFINRYEGAPRRYWYLSIARRAIRETMNAALREQHNEIVWPEFQRRLTFSKRDRAALDREEATMERAPIDGWGNRRAKEASRRAKVIRERVYRTTLETIREELAA